MLKVKKPVREHPEARRVGAVLDRTQTRRLNANIPADLHHDLRVYGAQHDKSITTLVIEALTQRIAKP